MRAFVFRLALALGKTLGELAAMPSEELTQWVAFYLWENAGAPVEKKQTREEQQAVFRDIVAALTHGRGPHGAANRRPA